VRLWLAGESGFLLRLQQADDDAFVCRYPRTQGMHTWRKAMGMEHRWSTRRQITFEAVIHYPALGLVRSEVKNISFGGMCIETGVISLNANTPVDVTVRVRRYGTDRVFHLPAWVVWAGSDKAGLMFRPFDDTAYAALQEALFDEPGLVETGDTIGL
jgi:hypothetical protein